RRARGHRPREAAAARAHARPSRRSAAALRQRRQGGYQPRDGARGTEEDARLDPGERLQLRDLGAKRAQQDRERAEQVGRVGGGREEIRRAEGRSEEAGRSEAVSDPQESFISHLIELRQRLVRSVAVVLGLFVVFIFW